MFGNTSYGSWIISTTNSLCVINGNLVLQTVCFVYKQPTATGCDRNCACLENFSVQKHGHIFMYSGVKIV